MSCPECGDDGACTCSSSEEAQRQQRQEQSLLLQFLQGMHQDAHAGALTSVPPPASAPDEVGRPAKGAPELVPVGAPVGLPESVGPAPGPATARMNPSAAPTAHAGSAAPVRPVDSPPYQPPEAPALSTTEGAPPWAGTAPGSATEWAAEWARETGQPPAPPPQRAPLSLADWGPPAYTPQTPSHPLSYEPAPGQGPQSGEPGPPMSTGKRVAVIVVSVVGALVAGFVVLAILIPTFISVQRGTQWFAGGVPDNWSPAAITNLPPGAALQAAWRSPGPDVDGIFPCVAVFKYDNVSPRQLSLSQWLGSIVSAARAHQAAAQRIVLSDGAPAVSVVETTGAGFDNGQLAGQVPTSLYAIYAAHAGHFYTIEFIADSSYFSSEQPDVATVMANFKASNQ